MPEPNRVTAYLKVTAEFYDPDATPETVRACVEQDLEDAGYEVEIVPFDKDNVPCKLVSIGIPPEYANELVRAAKKEKWISVKDRLPPERDTIFAKLKGTDKWNPNMFAKASDDVRVVVRFEDGTRMVSHAHTFDGKWRCETEKAAYPKRTVTHWMENPKLPEDEA